MIKENEFFARLRQWPEPSPYWAPNWPSKAREGHTGHFSRLVRECPVCGKKEDRILLREIRPSFARDEELPTLLVLDLWTSPRGAFTWSLTPTVPPVALVVPHYYRQDDAIVFALLAPGAKISIVQTRRYYEPGLWPWWLAAAGSGRLATQECDTCTMVWLEGDILPLPEPELVTQPHRRCRGAEQQEVCG